MHVQTPKLGVIYRLFPSELERLSICRTNGRRSLPYSFTRSSLQTRQLPSDSNYPLRGHNEAS